jgi:hypothetical protein
MNVIESLKSYFKKKESHQGEVIAPEGVCPNCWGKQEWDNEYYTFMKGETGNPSEDVYNTFVKEVARKLDKITIKENTYICETCKIKYNEK